MLLCLILFQIKKVFFGFVSILKTQVFQVAVPDGVPGVIATAIAEEQGTLDGDRSCSMWAMISIPSKGLSSGGCAPAIRAMEAVKSMVMVT